MMRKLKLLVLPMATALAIMLPAAAHAEPTCWGDHNLGPACIGPEGLTQPLSSTVDMIQIHAGKKLLLKSHCSSIVGSALYANGSEHGEGEVQSLGFTCEDTTKVPVCATSEVVVTASGLPWKQFLEEREALFPDEWQGMALTVRCGVGPEYGTFEGTLTPQAGEFDDTKTCHDDADAAMLHFSPLKGLLIEKTTGATLSITGSMRAGGRVQPMSLPC
jgi:hypothetical protein